MCGECNWPVESRAEFGSSGPIAFASVTLRDSEGKVMDIKCKCGNEASSVILGKEAYTGLCNKCQYGE